MGEELFTVCITLIERFKRTIIELLLIWRRASWSAPFYQKECYYSTDYKDGYYNSCYTSATYAWFTATARRAILICMIWTSTTRSWRCAGRRWWSRAWIEEVTIRPAKWKPYLATSQVQFHKERNVSFRKSNAYCKWIPFNVAGIQPLNWLFAMFLERQDTKYCRLHSKDEIQQNQQLSTYNVSRGRLARTFIVPVNMLFCSKLQ